MRWKGLSDKEVLNYFNKRYSNRRISRNHLRKESSGLYEVLKKRELLQIAIPISYNYRGFASPLEFFKYHYGNHSITRSQLEKLDKGLCDTLRRQGIIDEAIPNKRKITSFGENPLIIFQEKYPDQNLTRQELSKKDRSLYQALHRRGLMDIAIPQKRGRSFKGHDSSLDYFNKIYGNQEITRGKLSKIEPGLYDSLRRHGLLDKAIPKKWGDSFRGFPSPLDFFKDKYADKDISRGQLQKEDSSLYAALRRRGQIDLAIPERNIRLYRGFKDLFTYFRAHYPEKISRKKLQKEDSGLYSSLLRLGLMDQAIPEKQGLTYRGFSSPLEYFRHQYGKRAISRSQLQKEDRGLYLSLRKKGQINIAIPSIKKRDFKGDPLTYFRKKYKNIRITRKQLSVEDSGLYSSLLRKKELSSAIPARRNKRDKRNFNGNPIKFFREKYGDERITISRLKKEDYVLYQSLLNSNQITEIVFIDGMVDSPVKYQSFVSTNQTAKNLSILAASSKNHSGAILERLVQLYPRQLKKSRSEIPKWVQSLSPYIGPFTVNLNENPVPSIDSLLGDLPEQVFDEDFKELMYKVAVESYMPEFNKRPKTTINSLEKSLRREKNPHISDILKRVHDYYQEIYDIEIPGIKSLSK